MMPQVLCWECPRTSQIFKTKIKYLRHLKKMARASLSAKAEALRESQKAEFFTAMRNTVETVKDLETFIEANWDQFVQNGNDRRAKHDDSVDRTPIPFRHVKINITDHQVEILPHHVKDVIAGTPGIHLGWSGTVSLGYKNSFKCFPSDVFKGTGIHCGGGSGISFDGYESSRYQCTVFLLSEEWPAMVACEEKKNVLKRLTETNNVDHLL
jgi:hypothetical protein